MEFQLMPLTDAGQRFTALAEQHAADFAGRADKHDRDGTFPLENIEDLKRARALLATLPAELGGMGLDSLHDFAVGLNRVGRGDGSTGLAVTMHLFRVWTLAWSWRIAQRSDDQKLAQWSEKWLRRVLAGDVIAAVVSEPGSDLLHPLTEAVRHESGWHVTGRKIFATGSPAAQLLGLHFRFPSDDDRGYRVGHAYVAVNASGVTVANNWDALGMRASGSHDVIFKNCFIPDTDFIARGAWGAFDLGYLVGNLVSILGQSAVFLGVAEAAHSEIVEAVKTRRKGVGGRPLAELHATQRLIAENEIALAACRAMLERTSEAADGIFAAHRDTPLPMDLAHRIMKDGQCTKWFVTRHAVEIVDGALTASGGSGYLTKSRLSRLYRDVRAGQFMQPFSPNEAFEYIGKVTLGLDPSLSRT
jgi:alkylation response protein AidB-like acyl-CoA dehydrogenase